MLYSAYSLPASGYSQSLQKEHCPNALCLGGSSVTMAFFSFVRGRRKKQNLDDRVFLNTSA